MASQRKVVFANGEYYHVYNRGFEKRKIFTDAHELVRAQELSWYYSHKQVPIRYSKFKSLPQTEKNNVVSALNEKIVEIIAYCFMPNHFHFLLKQVEDNGITTFISNFSNSYTKYFNTRHKRDGSLLHGVFRSVYVEDENQLLHLSRYIHLNPVTSYLVKKDDLLNYKWSSLPEYLEIHNRKISSPADVLHSFRSTESYKFFCFDQIDYARELKKIEHLILE